MNHVYVVLDSMAVMHYTWFEDYPWHDHPEFKSKKVIIVFVRPVVEELDRHKDSHKRGNVRKRCKKALGWIDENLGGKMGAEVEIKTDLFALADFKLYTGHQAVRTDDRILEFAMERDESVTICSGDYTLRLMAKENGLKAVTPLDVQRITDDEETELQGALKELEVLKSRLPKLSVSVTGNEIQYSRVSLPFTTDEYYFERFNALTAGLQPPEVLRHVGGLNTLEASERMFTYMHRYDPREVERYKEQLQHALKESLALLELVCASPQVDLHISNEGTCSATDVEVMITAPEGFTIIRLDEFELPKMPKLPKKVLERLDGVIFAPRFPNQPLPEPNTTFRTEKNVGVWRAKKMSHHKTFQVPPFLVLGDTKRTFDDYGLEVAALASELPKRTLVNMPVKLSERSDVDERRLKWIAEKLTRHFESPSEASKRMGDEAKD